MTPVDDLDLATAPLAGTVLVEANAGTGKTWTIAALYVRLLLERALGVEQLLVLTFGVAATAELKMRIRDRLASVRAALAQDGLAALASRGDALLAHLGRTVDDAPRAVARLTLALESFDQAPIFTLHAFCQRVLAEHAFESGTPFVFALAPDETALVDEVAQDFWRRETAVAPPAWLAWLAAKGVTPATFADDIRRIANRPYAALEGPEDASFAPLERFLAVHAEARALWAAEAPALRARLAGVWNERERHARFRDVEACLAAPLPLPPLADPLEQFTRAKLKGRVEHAFIDAMDRLWSSAAAALAALRTARAAQGLRLARYARDELARRKRERALLGYGDMVSRLHAALAGDRGAALAATLRTRYPAALLDEFQDTDPLQASIFARLYGDGRAAVYYVGDPKQAIYGFRGADVQAYLAAGAHAALRHTLRVNRRSSAALVRAVNAVFAREHAFLDPGIAFHPSEAAPEEPAPLALRHDFPASFTVWFMTGADGKPLDKGAANERASAATADAIAQLLAPAAGAGEARTVAGRDIAVLVPTHRQGGLVRKALAQRGIASVTYGNDSVYRTAEAVAVERILLAIAEPGREPLVRGALVTDLLGATAERLAHYDATPAAWDAVQARFIAYRERAAKRGFIRMWRELLEGEGIPGRLLALPDGDRRLTNLQHLSELLQQAAARDGLDVGALARLLARQRAGRGGDTDAQLLRLESDEQLVRVLTIHAAKGLEFPVVFLPFLWDGPRRAAEDGPAVCHQAGGALIDFGTDDFDARAAAAQDEQRAEHLRLAYVALTRATQRCILAWGHVKDGDRSPLASLLHGAHGHAFRLFDEARLRADLAHLAAASGGAIAVQDLPLPLAPRPRAADASAGATLATRVFHGTIAAPWRVSSFSGLLARRALEAPDHDAQGPEAWDAPARPADSSQRTVFDFPGGTRAGTLIHALFERVDFADPGGERAATAVAEVLAAHRYESSWSPVLRTMLRDVLTTPLARGGWCLADIGEHARVTELEFLFPVDAGAPALAAGVAPPRGFLRGFIDLVFTHGERWYVLDWKSNRLGSRVEDYAAARLEQTMRESLYDLQYRLYTVALHRHLAARLPGYDYDRHFGGVFYLFVRGMRPAAGAANGVYFARPERADIESLSRALSPSRGHA